MLRVVTTMAAVLVVLVPASIASAMDFDVSRQPSSERTRFALACAEYPCEARLEVFRHGRRILDEQDFETYADYVDEVSNDLATFYKWSCNRTGLHRWHMIVTHNDDDVDGGEPDLRTETQRGTFRVGRCGKTRPRRVSRSTAAYKASGAGVGWVNEFVSSVRCSPLEPLVHGRASKWHCVVVHNNTYRECTSPLTFRYTQRLKFGRTLRKVRERLGRDRCTYF